MSTTQASPHNVDEYLSSESGARDLNSRLGKFVTAVLLIWSCFQLWYASPLPFIMNLAINEDQAKFIHLSFALFLAYCLFSFNHSSNHKPVNWIDLVLGCIASATALYLLVNRDALVDRIGIPTTGDVVIAAIGMIMLLEATRRSLGLPLVIVAAVFLTYTFAGQYMPDVIAHKGASLNKVASHQWLTTEGVFGVALGVSTTFVFLFVLLGSFLDHAGAGNYLIKVSFSLLGHLRGGPAKAAVVASGLSGIISGSSIANVVTTGTFTIPLMKRVGFPGTKAGAVEVAASTNGQLTPPIMGAAAFLMVEYVGISYIEVIKHAILPAIISYIALIYIVHLEALKLNMKGIKRLNQPTFAQRMLIWCSNILILTVLALGIFYGTQWIETITGGTSLLILLVLAIAAYIALLKVASRYPDLKEDDSNIELEHLPEVKSTVLSGLYFSVPIVVLLWALGVKHFSPQQSAFYAIFMLGIIVLSHHPIKAWFRKEGGYLQHFYRGWNEFIQGMISAARNMVGIGIATAAAGIVVGTVTLTGLGQMMTAFVEFISGGNLLLILVFTAVICIVLGMGLPTTANYIVVSTLMAPVIVNLGAENGLIVPLIAVHLFVFYFGILADDTPPVGLAAYAAAAISGDDPIKTGIQGFTYDIRTAILPFMFIFNTQLLLIGIDSVFDLIITIFSAILAMLVFSAATQGFWLVKTKWWETAVLLLIAFSLFRPGFFWDKIYPPTIELPASSVMKSISEMKSGEFIDLKVEGISIEGNDVKRTVSLQMNSDAQGAEARLESMGLALIENEGRLLVDRVMFASPAEKAGIDFDFEIIALQQKSKRPPKELVFIPAILLLIFIGFMQSKRRKQLAPI